MRLPGDTGAYHMVEACVVGHSEKLQRCWRSLSSGSQSRLNCTMSLARRSVVWVGITPGALP